MILVELEKCYKELHDEMTWPGRHPEFISAIECAIADLGDLPHIEARPVVHAKWVCLEPEIGYFACSECDHRILRAKSNYCPNCGATMDLDEEGTDE